MKIKFKCQICGYIYNPDEGDSQGGIPTGTAFDDLPDDWKCPLCTATKTDFIEDEYFE